MDVLINSLIVCFGVGFISSLQIWILYRLSYVQLQVDELRTSLAYITDLMHHPEQMEEADEDEPDQYRGFHNGIHNANSNTQPTQN
jgi:hypothetical protein